MTKLSRHQASRLAGKSLAFIALFAGLFACGAGSRKQADRLTTEEVFQKAPEISADSAYAFVQQQVDFGPRVPGTAEHLACAGYLVSKLKEYGAATSEQKFDARTYDNKYVPLVNITASLFPEKKKRILLTAHWDTRPFADKDKEQPMSAFDGADDGGSGVAVILEILRTIHTQSTKPDVGIDVVFFDGEEWGEPEGFAGPHNQPEGKSFWCLGSQYWAREARGKGITAYYAINLDMVGAKDAKFYKEGTSMQFAPSIVRKVWKAARKLGYGNHFPNRKVYPVTDDHEFINTEARIPAIDIINYDGMEFGSHHHTRADNMDNISKETLKAVGQTVIQVLYSEK